MIRSEELLLILATIVAIVTPLLILAAIYIIPRDRLRILRTEFRSRSIAALPFFLILGAVLAFNARYRMVLGRISEWIGFEITHLIVRLEGQAVVHFHNFVGGEWAIIFFTFMYVYGYVFLLVFPLIAYYFMPDLDLLKALTMAYTINYLVGSIFYTLFIAFGPRNRFPELFGETMHTYYPQLSLLTTQVNEFTNVFPSLHTSLSATVMIFAWYSHSYYRRWTPIALFIGTCVIISTMYLAQHWVVDVIAGIALAAVSCWIGIQAVESDWLSSDRLANTWSRIARTDR